MKATKTYTRDDYAPFIGKSGQTNAGLHPLPNATDVDPLMFLQDLAARGHMMQPVWGYALLPDGSRQQWTQFFLLADANMAMQLGGGGYAVTYGKSSWDEATKKSVQHPIVRRFQICKHEIELAAGANPDRGWRPGACKHCGMDMTIDSEGLTMSTIIHTPGPWVWRGKSGTLHRVGTEPYAYGETVLAAEYEHDSGLDTKVSEADAALIAAAPDMLAALKMAKLWTDPDWVAWEHICKAIDRAEGRS